MSVPQELRVLFLAAEAAPLIKVGGLGDVAGALPQALRAIPPEKLDGKKLDVRLVIPFHGRVSQNLRGLQPVASFFVQLPAGPLGCSAFLTMVDDLPVYLIQSAHFLGDIPVYTTDNYRDGLKYGFFSLAALELCRHIHFQPDILHANDWHTAVSIHALASHKQEDDFFANTHSVFSIHNLPYMGAGAEQALSELGIPPTNDSRLPYWARQFPLPLGLLSADYIVAVSGGYAREILSPSFGCGLQDFLATREDRLTGIINGLDYTAWNPADDQSIFQTFDLTTLDQRMINKRELQKSLNLEVNDSIPLMGFIGRMDQQKGIDLIVQGLRMATDIPWQVILLGTGDPLLETSCRSLEAEIPDRVRSLIRFDSTIAHRMYAGTDILVIPSRYEPCGLVQMIAMRYGCVPLARSTGGLKDTIVDLISGLNSTGFLFGEASPSAFVIALRRALAVYQDKTTWQAMQVQGMKQVFTWDQSALDYAKIYVGLEEGTL